MTNNTALNYLNNDRLLHAGMILPIMRGSAEIIYASEKGVLLREIKSGALMLSAGDVETGRGLLAQMTGGSLHCVHQKPLADELERLLPDSFRLDFYQVVYTGGALPLSGEIEIRELDMSFADVVHEHYKTIDDPEYIAGRIRDGELFGGFLGGGFVGFAGLHEEGSMGLMEIFPEYKRRGFGAELERYLINLMLGRGFTPFGQVSQDNAASLALQKKLGLEITTEPVSWFYK